MTTPDDRPRYRLITGPDDKEFCRRVSEALAEGYQLHGAPTLVAANDRIIAGQALVRSVARSIAWATINNGLVGHGQRRQRRSAAP